MLRWAGNKTSILNEILQYIPKEIQTYHEPYLGSGSVFLNLPTPPKNAYLNDINPFLISFFQTIFSDNKFDVWQLVDLTNEKIKNIQTSVSPEDKYYSYRAYFNEMKSHMPQAEKASYFLLFNILSHNGIWRENKSKGNFNTPLQHTQVASAKSPTANEILKHKARFDKSNVIFTSDNWLNTELSSDLTDHFYYIDSPYSILEDQKSILQYSGVPFNENEQIIQADKVAEIHARNGKFCISNSKTPLIEKLYSQYHMVSIRVIRKMANQTRGIYHCDEVIIYN